MERIYDLFPHRGEIRVDLGEKIKKFGKGRGSGSRDRGLVQNIKISGIFRKIPKFSIRKLYSNPVSRGARGCLRAVPITIWVV